MGARKYRTKEEEERFEARDPIDTFIEYLTREHGMTEEEHKTLGKEVRAEIREAVKWAEASPPPGIEELYTDVYVEKWGPYRGTSRPQMLTDEEQEE